ncbi:CLUMA_CG014717, isoform A [Clunio marinus]|uniref:CLUMA_CG014717, isoform A n=1 Tax=Clunio marinus TaxID=568069 RepID=A0A1J1IN37_9DIPT|nr:CLUMA_CG014717, isoform A [Clunio marinus]
MIPVHITTQYTTKFSMAGCLFFRDMKRELRISTENMKHDKLVSSFEQFESTSSTILIRNGMQESQFQSEDNNGSNTSISMIYVWEHWGGLRNIIEQQLKDFSVFSVWSRNNINLGCLEDNYRMNGTKCNYV